ncbi:aminopeptidase [Gordonibacter sp. An230]|nr:aminopeptidase [Gordonibacter sp. An230]
MYLTEQMQKEAGLSAVIEDFSGAPSAEAPKVVCCSLSFVFGLLSLFVPMFGVAAIVVTLVAVALFAAEVFDRPVLSKIFVRGVSQNVVAKYEPGYSAQTGGTRRRKVILVARYDTGKVRTELASPVLPALRILQWATFGAMVLLPILLIMRVVAFPNAEGALDATLLALIVIALVSIALPLVVAVLHKAAPYNEGANCNASGTAVLLEVARRVGRGRVSEAELAERDDVEIHGAEAARAGGFVPEGAQLVYEASNVKPPEMVPQTPEERLAAAKAAIAALSGKPVSGVAAVDISQNLVQVKEPPVPEPTAEDIRALHDETREAFSSLPAETMQAALANAEAAHRLDEGSEGPVSMAEESVVGEPAVSAGDETPRSTGGVPDWFKKAQEKAKKPRGVDKPVQRSRYASALDAASSESAGHFAGANPVAEEDASRASDEGRVDDREVQAPQWSFAHDDASDPHPAESQEVAVPSHPVSTENPSSPASESEVDPLSTTAMPPIDVSSFNLDDVPPVDDLPLPSFLDPRKVQKEAQSAVQDEQRTDNRVDVTAVPIGDSGRIDFQPDSVPPTNDDVCSAPVETTEAAVSSASERGSRRPIVLPDIGLSGKLAPITELPKQRAPLAEAESSGKTAAKSLLSMLPAIDLGASGTVEPPAEDVTAAAKHGKKSGLRSMLPSLSGSIARVEEEGRSSVSAAGSFAPAGATGAFAPIGDELLQNVDPEDIYVDDADDSAYEENYTETGAFAGPGYVEMPKSRIRRLFDRFRRKKDEEEPTPQEWLDVDESFDARTVGAERGGWESFREDATAQMEIQDDFSGDEFDEYEDRAVGDGYGEGDQYVQHDEYGEYDESDLGGRNRDSGGRSWNGGAFSPRRMERAELDSERVAEESAAAAERHDQDVSEEIEHIYQFRNPDINTEVWFVALGSELSQNGGMRAFLTEHQQDLRGSIIIDLDGLGAGDLCMVELEGQYRTVKTSSRMKRYVRKASQATGLDVGSTQLPWMDSSASYAMKHGYQAMHLVGMHGGKPAYFAQADDVLENVEEDKLEKSANFVMELLKNI